MVQDATVKLAEEVRKELLRSQGLHSPMNSAHEALAVIEEEIDEFKKEVYKKREQRDKDKMREELVQTAAMCMRSILDLNLG